MSNQKNKISRVGLVAAYMTVGMLVLALLVNLIVGMLPESYKKINVTGEETFQVSQKTKKYLDTLEEDVTLYFISEGGVSGTENEIYLFLSQFADSCDRITLEVVDPTVNTEFILAYGGEWPENMSIIAQSAKRYKLITNSDLYYYFNATVGMNMTPMEYEYYCQQFVTLMQSDPSYQNAYLSFVEQTVPFFDGNSKVANAINYVTLERIPKIYVRVDAKTGTGLDYGLLSRLDLNGYQISNLSSVQTIPADCDLLILHGLTTDLNGAEAMAVKNYLATKSGRLLVTTNLIAGVLSNLEGILKEYGMSYESAELICEGAAGYMMGESSQPYPNFIIAQRDDHAASSTFTGKFVAPNSHAIKLTPTEGVTQTSWLYTSEKAYTYTVTDTEAGTVEKGDPKKFTLGAIAEKGESRVIWLSCSMGLTDDGDTLSSGANYQMASSIIAWLTDSGNHGLEIDPATVSTGTLNVTVGQFTAWGVILIIVLPAAFLATGFIIRQKRKKR